MNRQICLKTRELKLTAKKWRVILLTENKILISHSCDIEKVLESPSQ